MTVSGPTLGSHPNKRSLEGVSAWSRQPVVARIEDVASSLFRERGYAGTSVRDIARAVDIQGASLYAHVASKQDVLWTIVERMASRFEHAADDALQSVQVGPAADAATQLAALVRAHVEVLTDDLGRATVFVQEWRSLDPGSSGPYGRSPRRLRATLPFGHRRRR